MIESAAGECRCETRRFWQANLGCWIFLKLCGDVMGAGDELYIHTWRNDTEGGIGETFNRPRLAKEVIEFRTLSFGISIFLNVCWNWNRSWRYIDILDISKIADDVYFEILFDILLEAQTNLRLYIDISNPNRYISNSSSSFPYKSLAREPQLSQLLWTAASPSLPIAPPTP